ncbi:hypothetical protein [Winogradskyella psychrotolerans]|uniref:hypothetical protein n=1 Tax=Winogradskyella psychrotolerans TaxID=1344585 RepID=UPI001C06C421|nr:hypothetical protein [Winogradskyella psychrotolerans]MBU2928466.1 hypothetical protein [Winogradskyella psychrotolerans]
MKYLCLFVVIFGLFFTACKAKKSSLNYRVYSCEDGIAEAIKDAGEGNYELISYGLISIIEVDGFNQFYRNHLIENYNIILSLDGCIVTEGSNCYREKIEELIYQRYGNDIFELSKLEAIQEFRNTEEFIKEIKPKIDSGKIYWSSMLHQQPKFLIEGKDEDLLRFLGFAKFEKDDYYTDDYCVISFNIEKNGTITEIEFKNLKTSETLFNEVLLEKLHNIPKWQPGQYLNEQVRSYASYRVPLRLFEKYPR